MLTSGLGVTSEESYTRLGQVIMILLQIVEGLNTLVVTSRYPKSLWRLAVDAPFTDASQ